MYNIAVHFILESLVYKLKCWNVLCFTTRKIAWYERNVGNNHRNARKRINRFSQQKGGDCSQPGHDSVGSRHCSQVCSKVGQQWCPRPGQCGAKHQHSSAENQHRKDSHRLHVVTRPQNCPGLTRLIYPHGVWCNPNALQINTHTFSHTQCCVRLSSKLIHMKYNH